MSFSSTPLFVHVKPSIYSMILIFVSNVILIQWLGIYFIPYCTTEIKSVSYV